MSCEDHSVYSYEKSTAPLLGVNAAKMTHKVKYQSDSEWDFVLDDFRGPVDLCLNLPHYRARSQPVDHRMSMFIGGGTEPIKLKVRRNAISRSKFYLEIQATTADTTVWLPSDFNGQIHHGGRAAFSPGFVNRVLRNVRFNEDVVRPQDDEVVVVSNGLVTFKMWDVETGAPENGTKEHIRRLFGCSRKEPTSAIDWDFLVRDC